MASAEIEEIAPVDVEQAINGDVPTIDDEALREAVWARVQMARNVERPHTLELVQGMATDVVELHGDRRFGDDPALVGGFATIGDHRVVFMGHQKGNEVDENIRRNFGMPHPEGYRKAGRLLMLAERLGLPVVTFVDTPGAEPVLTEERKAGQPRNRTHGEHVADDTGQGILVDDASPPFRLCRGILILVQLQLLDCARRERCRNNDRASGAVVDDAVRNTGCFENQGSVGTTPPITTLKDNAQVFHRCRVTVLR